MFFADVFSVFVRDCEDGGVRPEVIVEVGSEEGVEDRRYNVVMKRNARKTERRRRTRGIVGDGDPSGDALRWFRGV